MARNSKYIIDEYTERKDLTRLQKWRLRHPEQVQLSREYTKNYIKENPDHVKNWRKKNPEKYKEQGKKWVANQRWKRYNITEKQYLEMLEQQNYVCAVCKKDKDTKHDWSIDHCHSTNKVRGILCSRCNSMLGQAKDNINTLTNAITYLRAHAK